MSTFRPLRGFRNPFQSLYDEAGMAAQIRRSLTAVVFGNICGNMWFSITNGSALTGYARQLGANDLVFGILSGIPMAATLMQFPAALLVSRTQKRKQYMLTYGVLSRALWIVIGLLPYLLPINPAWLPLWSVIFLVGIASASGSFINVCFMPWMADLVPLNIRGRWISTRDGIVSIFNVAIGLVTAWLLDHIPGFTGYALVFTLGGVLGVMDMLCFIFAEEMRREDAPPRATFRQIFHQVLTDKPFFRFMLFWTAWCFTANLSGPYLQRYALEMGLNFMQLTLFGQIAPALATVLVISRWGRLMDHYGTKPVLWVSCIVASLTPAFFLAQTPGSFWPILLHSFIGALFWSAANSSSVSKLLSSSPDDQRPSYVAFYSCVTNLLGSFAGVLCGGVLLQGLQSALGDGTRVLGMDRYQLLIVLSVFARLGIVLAMVPRLHNEREATASTMLRDLGARISGR